MGGYWVGIVSRQSCVGVRVMAAILSPLRSETFARTPEERERRYRWQERARSSAKKRLREAIVESRV